MDAKLIRQKLARWYDRNKRSLPWRSTSDAYTIWISEVMLQQTRVAAVIPYYERFLKRFPDAATLARAPEEDVLTLWSGLGYYSRARNLQKAAQQIIKLGLFPRTYDEIRSLSGIGDYTAAAVSSIAFGLPHAVVDGNVRRVVARITNGKGDTKEVADLLLDRANPSRSNQAIMELGAMVCVPRDPHCGECPVAAHCEARKLGTQNELPSKRSKPTAIHLKRILLLIERRGKVLLAPSSRVLGFWDLPEPFEGVQAGDKLGAFRHTITHRHYQFVVHEGVTRTVPAGLHWFAWGKMNEIPLSATAKKGLRLHAAFIAP